MTIKEGRPCSKLRSTAANAAADRASAVGPFLGGRGDRRGLSRRRGPRRHASPSITASRNAGARAAEAPLLVSILSWAERHGLVFAGPVYKNRLDLRATLMTIAVPSSRSILCRTRPMLTAAARRWDVGQLSPLQSIHPSERRVHALDWLEPASRMTHGDIRAVVDWIAGRSRSPASASAKRQLSSRAQRQGDLVEALCGD